MSDEYKKNVLFMIKFYNRIMQIDAQKSNKELEYHMQHKQQCIKQGM